jgi:ferredoxin
VYRIQIDRSLCSGFGSCADLAPRSVRLGPDGLAEPTAAPDTQDDDVLEAAASCPMGAIAVFDETDAQVA